MFEAISPEAVKELPSLIIFVLALGWVIRKFHIIVTEYNKMIFDMSSQCRSAHKEIAEEHRLAVRDLVTANAKGIDVLTSHLENIKDITAENRVRIMDIHSAVVEKKGKK